MEIIRTINNELTSTKLPLSNIYLDPNNPRFLSMDWDEIPSDKIDEDYTQAMTRAKLEEKFSVDKLVMNMEHNGYLPIDRVVVQQFKGDKYVVLEGNRRICAAKIIYEKHSKSPQSISESVIDSIEYIECLVYTGSEQEPSWIFQGLRHIIGIQDWSAFNKAKLLVKLMEEEQLSLTEVGKRFGLTAFGAGQWVRGYYAFKMAAEESDYTREVDERAYPYFQEIFSRSNLLFKDWLQWDDGDYLFRDNLNFNEFLSWLYPRDEEENDDIIDIKGDWTKRKLARSSDLRMISYLLRESPSYFKAFRSDGDLEKAYNMANTEKYIRNADPTKETFDNINACIKSLENIPLKIVVNDSEKLLGLLDKIEQAINAIKDSCSEK